jgi:FkbM family methyltransferase
MTFRLLTSLRRRAADWRHPAGFRVAERAGARWLLNHRHYVDRQMLFSGDYEAAQRARLFALAREAGCRTFVDVGANFGLYSVQAALSGGFKAVHAFEPDGRNLAQLRANLLLNGLLGTVFVHETAVSDHDGTVSFAAGGDRFTGQSRVIAQNSADSVEIPAIRLDSHFSQNDGFCLKIDVEGHENAVIDGAAGLLRENSWVIQVECLDAGGDLARILAGYGAADAGAIGNDRYFVRRG